MCKHCPIAPVVWNRELAFELRATVSRLFASFPRLSISMLWKWHKLRMCLDLRCSLLGSVALCSHWLGPRRHALGPAASWRFSEATYSGVHSALVTMFVVFSRCLAPPLDSAVYAAHARVAELCFDHLSGQIAHLPALARLPSFSTPAL